MCAITILQGSAYLHFLSMPLATHGETVAYFSMRGEEILLVVQNMFDSATYYKEFDRDFSVSCVLG